MIDKEIIYPRFIDTQPLGDDLFEGKSQRKIAQSIWALIKENCNQIIGIEGEWGSGKSNIIGIIESEYETDFKNGTINNEFYFFKYDAWGHQEDEQRRSILEELTEFLTNIEDSKFDSKKWNERLKLLLAKNKETNTKNKPTVSLGIILSFLAVILTPIFNVIFENISCVWLKGLFVSIPLLLIVVYFFYKYYKTPKYIKDKRRKCKYRAKDAFQSLYEIYQRDQIETTTYEMISEDIPTVKKFKDWMTEIDADMQNNKLVIIIDNMDRLPEIKVQELWSSIHVFFAETTNPYINISLIVPFDRKHILKAFKAFSEKDFNNKECYGNDFINKTFKVIFRVAPPIMSNWKKFFRDKWKDAIEKQNEIDINKVIQIFEHLSPKITPRNIIAFINEVVSIKLLTKDSIPERYIALFILGKHEILEKPLEQIIQPSYLSSLEFLYKDDKNMQEYITALTYQIDPDNALEVIYTDKLKSSLDKADYKTVLQISKTSAFTEILQNVIPNITNIENAIFCLNKVESKFFKNIDIENSIWDEMYEKSEGCTHEGQKIREYHKILFEKCSDRKRCLLRIIDDLYKIAKGEKFNAVDFYESINLIITTLNSDNKEELNPLNHLRNAGADPADFIEFVKLAKESFIKYNIVCDEKALNNVLVKYDHNQLREADYVKYLIDEYDLNEFQTYITGLISKNNGNKNLLQPLLVRARDIGLNACNIITDDIIYNQITKLQPNEDLYYELLAIRIAKGTKFNNQYSSQIHSYLNSPKIEDAKKIWKILPSYMSLDELLVNLNSFSKHELYVNICKVEFESDSTVFKTQFKPVIEKIEVICKILNITPDNIFKKLDLYIANFDIRKDEFEKILNSYVLEHAKTSSSNIAKYLIKKAEIFLESLDESEWFLSTHNNSSPEIRKALIINIKWQNHSISAFREFLKEVSKGTFQLPSKHLWNTLIESIDKQGRKLTSFFNEIRDVFCESNVMTIEYFIFFGEWLLKYSSLDKRPESLRRILPVKILEDDSCLDIIFNYRDKLSSIIKASASDEGQSELFIEAIKEKAKTSEDKRFKELAKLLKNELQDK